VTEPTRLRDHSSGRSITYWRPGLFAILGPIIACLKHYGQPALPGQAAERILALMFDVGLW